VGFPAVPAGKKGIEVGLIHGTATFSRYRVTGGLPDDYAEAFPRGILRYAFRNLDDLPNEERSTGWVNILDMFDNSFSAMEYFKDPYLALSWRVDEKKIPARALRQYTLEAENEVKRREELAYLPKSRRDEIRESVHLKLLKRAIPQSNVYDVIWHLQTGDLLFGATSNKLCDEFVEIFRNTFDRLPAPVHPYAQARHLLEMAGKDPGTADGMKPLSFAGEVMV
jgi:recombination associated protein RdgC